MRDKRQTSALVFFLWNFVKYILCPRNLLVLLNIEIITVAPNQHRLFLKFEQLVEGPLFLYHFVKLSTCKYTLVPNCSRSGVSGEHNHICRRTKIEFQRGGNLKHIKI